MGDADGFWFSVPVNSIKKEPSEQISKFLQDTQIGRYYLTMNEYGHAYLTTKEMTCVRWMSIGKTAEEIAMIENNSIKTIQRHIENIKNKLNCQKKEQVIKILMEAGILDI